ncbi:MAG: type II toxin-antitoxin system RelE/ParE family toxin [Hyphomicrobiaceae bacterium]
MNVRYRLRALDDVQAIYDWRSRQSTEIAAKIEAAIFAAAEWLGRHPELGTMTDEGDVRRWPMTDFNYTIFYRTDMRVGELDVLRIMDARRIRNLQRLPRSL